VGMHGDVTELPPGGIVLSTKLAQTLGVRAGDLVAVEALVAPRPIEAMQVTALTDEMVGLGAYAPRDAVNRFMREGPSLTGASLAVEPSRAAALYATLKSTPAIASVSLREAMLESFRKTIAENMRVTAMMIVVFAWMIAFGVIYNGARIALSERGRDLASLRVLGFSSAEVGAMLIGEQAILTALSIPIGFAGGWLLCLWLVHLLESEMYRLPFVISGRTYALSFLIIAAAALFTAAVVQRRIARLDLVAVLKTRE
jgi:putative ABC transport system permease protein